MFITEQVQASNEVSQQKSQKRSYKNIQRPEETGHFTLCMIQYKQIEREKRKKILDEIVKIEEKYKAPINSAAAGKMLDELLKVIESALREKVMFGMPYELVHGMLSEKEKKQALKAPSLIGHLIKNLHFIKKQNLSLEESDKAKFGSIFAVISKLIKEGTYVSKEVLDSCRDSISIDSNLEDRRDNYLSGLEKAICNSIENDKKEGVVVERDSSFYSVQCPEDSVITPAKFINSPEFKDLEFGALRIGDGIIRIHNGKYHDMKGRITMTFNVGGKKLEMHLFSKKAHEPENNALNFGTIMVYMDDENCKIFNEHHEALKGLPRIERIIGRAKSFVDEKNGKQTEPFSVMEEIKAYKCADCGKGLS